MKKYLKKYLKYFYKKKFFFFSEKKLEKNIKETILGHLSQVFYQYSGSLVEKVQHTS